MEVVHFSSPLVHHEFVGLNEELESVSRLVILDREQLYEKCLDLLELGVELDLVGVVDAPELQAF